MIWPFDQKSGDTIKWFKISVEVVDGQHPISLVRDAENVDNVAALNDAAIGTNTDPLHLM